MIRCDLDLFHPYHLGKSIILQILEFGVSYGDTLIRELPTMWVGLVQLLPQILRPAPNRANWTWIPSSFVNTFLVRGLTTDAHVMT
jgi:hypothetical protein